MRFSRCIAQTIGIFSLVLSSSGITADMPETAKHSDCPTRPFTEIRDQFRPAPAQQGKALIDRAAFWNRMEKIGNAKEVFKFTARKKDKATGVVRLVEKEVIFHRSVTNPEHRAVIEAIFDRWEATGGGHPKHLALILGTAYRETCGIMASGVGEACGCSRTCSKDEYTGINKNYARKDSCGRAYFGRGFVQITHDYNYESVEKRLNIPLKNYPNLAYEQPFAIMMLVDGVKGRWFAGKPLNTYLDDNKSEWVLARDSVNPNSPNKAATGYLSCRFYDAIGPAYKTPAPAQDPALCMTLKNP